MKHNNTTKNKATASTRIYLNVKEKLAELVRSKALKEARAVTESEIVSKAVIDLIKKEGKKFGVSEI